LTQLPACSGEEAIRAFERLGYRRARQKGSHVFMKREGRKSISVPANKKLGAGLLRTLIRDSGFTVEEFVDAL
jgi:predicted RNA binding protein YcfA (HicA-like mRNA interferase family)